MEGRRSHELIYMLTMRITRVLQVLASPEVRVVGREGILALGLRLGIEGVDYA